MCPSADGIVATVENGRVTKIEADEEYPTGRSYACIKVRHEWETFYHSHRFKHPLLKTTSGWSPLSWEEAFDIAAERLGEIREKFGPLAFCATQPKPALMLLLRSLGSPNEMTNTDLCQGTAEVADRLTYGHVLTIYRSAEDFRNSKCVFLVGTNPPASYGGQWQDILHAKKNGAKLIVVDPRRTEAAREADLWLQIRPGTDGALALAMLNIVVNENLCDTDFVDNYCVGFDKLRKHVQQYTPEWASEITWLSLKEITQVARIYATNGPTSYRGNNGVTQHSNSTQTARAFAILSAITGNIDIPGGQLLPGSPPPGFAKEEGQVMTSTRLPREVEEKTLGANRFPLWSGPDSLMRKTHNPSVLNAIIHGEPYPVKAWIIMWANPVLTYADSRKAREALRRLEFLMVLAYTPSPTSNLADLILPISHSFEENGTRFSTYGNWLAATPKLVEPPEGCRDHVDIMYNIAERMVQKGYIEKNLVPWRNNDEMIKARFVHTDFTYEDLCEKGTMVLERKYRKYIEQGFRTPSSKVELYSSLMDRYGYEPLPVFKECEESPVILKNLAEKFPLLLTTRRSYNYYGSRGSGYEWVRKLTPYPTVQIHPSTAQQRGIQQGDLVVVETPRGSFQQQAEITGDIHPQVVNGAWAWWLPEKETVEEGLLETAVNMVTSYDPPYDPEIGINSVQGIMCQVRKL
jgi:anaerobic selenocysteine-containing dehydrogenase